MTQDGRQIDIYGTATVLWGEPTDGEAERAVRSDGTAERTASDGTAPTGS